MSNNELNLGVGRGRGRGRGRLNTNTEDNSGTWIRGDKLYHPTTSNAIASTYHGVTTSSQLIGNFQMFQETMRRDENQKVPFNSPSYTFSESSGSSTNQPFKPQHYSPRTSPLQQADRGQSIHASHPKMFSPPRQRLNQVRFRFDSPTLSHQDFKFNFRNDLKNVRSQLNNNMPESNRSQPNYLSERNRSQPNNNIPESDRLQLNSTNMPKSDRLRLNNHMQDNDRSQINNNMPESDGSQQNNKFNSANDSNSKYSPRRGNKRPVTSSTEGNGDTVILPKSSGFSGPQSKKNKKKKKCDTDSNDSKDQNKQTSLVNPELYQLKISENLSFTEQTEELISQLEQTKAERRMRFEVVKDVTDIFSPYLPNVEPQIYGSSLTNIAFKTSDLDIFLYCPQGQPEYNFVLERGRLMYKSPKFKNIVRVARARVPVIKATHIKTNVDVDISTMSGQAVYNSRLIKHLLSVDDRLRPLAMLISLWVKLNTITGPSRFTSYSIVLMLVYYLQNINPPILPPLKDILYSNDENDWPNFFDNKPLENKNNSNIAELFKGFFVFYRNIDFEKIVLSPYLGKGIPAVHFTKEIDQLTDEFSLYKNKLKSNITPFKITYTLHVQDPIEHNVNTTKGVFLRLMKLFQRSCERALDTCVDSLAQNKWLPLIIKQTPLKIIDERKYNILINYPVNDDKNWFQNCFDDFKELLKILLINIKDDDCNIERSSTSGKCNYEFFAEASYNVFNKRFRFPLRMYISGTIPLNELNNQFEMVINRVKEPAVLFNAKFLLEKQNENGSVKVTVTDKNMTGLNSFLSLASEFKRYCGKFLSDIIALKQSSLNEDKSKEIKVSVIDLDVESSEKLDSSIDNNKTVDSINRQDEINQVKDDSKAEQLSN